MSAKAFTSELDLALARPDAEQLLSLVAAYDEYFADTDGKGAWPEEWSDAFGDIMDWPETDPELALAYVILAAGRSNNPSFVAVVACGPLEDILRAPSDDMIRRIVAEARKSARFRWMLSHPFKVAVSSTAWQAIEPFRITGPHEEPEHESMPGSYFA